MKQKCMLFTTCRIDGELQNGLPSHNWGVTGKGHSNPQGNVNDQKSGLCDVFMQSGKNGANEQMRKIT